MRRNDPDEADWPSARRRSSSICTIDGNAHDMAWGGRALDAVEKIELTARPGDDAIHARGDEYKAAHARQR